MVLLIGCLDSGDRELGELSTEETGLVSDLPLISELAGTPAPEVPPLPILDPDEISLGQELYVKHCAECHGLDGGGDGADGAADGDERADIGADCDVDCGTCPDRWECEHGYPEGHGCPECEYWERVDYEYDSYWDR